MKFVLFYHSLVSDWNHGNAHFLRGIVAELLACGHRVDVYEPAAGWSRTQLLADHGTSALREFSVRFPQLRSRLYEQENLDLDAALDGADVAIVHEWNTPLLVRCIGRRRRSHPQLRLFFHDTHHRSVTASREMADYELRDYDGVLAFGEAVRRRYLENGWCARAWTWHEAADVRVFRPLPTERVSGDLVWIGNWGDGERNRELTEFLLEPVRSLGLAAHVHGVRYPLPVLSKLTEAGIGYRGWLPNWRAPQIYAQFRATVHVPRRPYAQALPGIPTIRVFEALACGIPLVSAPWQDSEGLFSPEKDFLVARSGAEMRRKLRDVLHDPALAGSLAAHGLRTIRARHTCTHRVGELLDIVAGLQAPVRANRKAVPASPQSEHASLGGIGAVP